MKNKTQNWNQSGRFGRSFIACFAAIVAIFTSQLTAGLINVNFTDTTASGLAPDGPGVLGAGQWNRIIDGDAVSPVALFDSNSTVTNASVSQTSGTAVMGQPIANGNPVQSESWFDAGGFILTVSGLLPGQVYKVAVYTDRDGSGMGLSDIYVVNGVGVSITNPGAALTGLPGTANVDYAMFEVTSTAAGQIAVTSPYSIAGMQIQGVLNGELGPQIDCRVAKKPNSTGGKGNGVYELKNSKKQTLKRKVKGSKTAKYYVNIENDGAEIDNCYLMGFWKKRHFKRVRVKDRLTGANVTAAALARNHRFVLDVGETKSFFVKAKRSKRRSGKTSLQVCSSPSTLVAAQQDCVTCLIK